MDPSEARSDDDEGHDTTGRFEEEDTGGGIGLLPLRPAPNDASGLSHGISAAVGPSGVALTEMGVDENVLARMSVGELTQLLTERGVDCRGCLDKADLIERLANPRPTTTRDHGRTRSRQKRSKSHRAKSHGARLHAASFPADDVLDIDWMMRGIEGGGDEILHEDEVMQGFAEIRAPPHRADTTPNLRSHFEMVSPPASPPASPPVSPRRERRDEQGEGAKPTSLPYAMLEVAFNHRNLYVPKTAILNPSQLRYDFDDDEAWVRLVTNRLSAQGRPKPAHEPLRLPPCPDERRLREMERQIRSELVEQVTRMRQTANTSRPRVNKLVRLVETIEGGLSLFERSAAGTDDPAEGLSLEREFDAWRRNVERETPSGSAVRGRPAHYTYTDPKRIRSHVLSTTRYAGIKRDAPLDFVIGVRCFGFFGGAVSVWVFVGVVDDFSAQVRALK